MCLRLHSKEFLCKQTRYVTQDAHLNTDIALVLESNLKIWAISLKFSILGKYNDVKCTSSYTNKYPRKVIILAIFRFAHYYIFVLFLYAALRLPPTMTSKSYIIRPSLFSPGHDFKKPNFWRLWSQISLEVFIHFRQNIYHSSRLTTANFWKKNGDDFICTLNSTINLENSGSPPFLSRH